MDFGVGRKEKVAPPTLKKQRPCQVSRTPQKTFLDRLDRTWKFDGMGTWQLQEAKQQFSKVAARAAARHPQLVTKHGKPFVVIVDATTWQQETAPRHSLLEVLRACPADLTGVAPARSRDIPRPAKL